MAKKSRRKRAAQKGRGPVQAPQPVAEATPVGPAPQNVQAPKARTVTAPKAAVRQLGQGSHNLGLELRMILLFGGGTVIIMIGLAFADPTGIVAQLLHL